jgi:hypothetical protein
LGDFQLILLYWPLVVVTLLPLLARWQRGLEVVRTRSGVVARGGLLVLLLLVPCVVQALPRGDKGAALVLLPPLMVAAVMCWWPRERGVSRLLAIGVALAVVLGATGFFGVHELLDRVFPPVARDSAQWESDVRGRACPAGSPSVDDPFALTDYPRVLDRGNIGLRMDEWFLPGASNRAGTRVGAQVHESLTILQRYAAGQDGSAAGSGYLSVPIRRYGSAEVDAQLFDGVPSVLVASEGGTLALAGLLLLHMALSAGVLRRAAVMLEGPEPSAPRRSVLVFGMVVTGLIPAWTTYLMVGNNLGLFPFTGQCTPLLGVLSGTDLLLAPVLWCMAVALGSAVGRGGEHEPA